MNQPQNQNRAADGQSRAGEAGANLTDVLAAFREVARAATQGQWKYGATPCPDKAKAMEIFEANLDATKSPNEYFFEVFLDDGRRTAVVGNGPTSEANSRFIATFGPHTVLQLLDKIEELMAANIPINRQADLGRPNGD